MTISVLLSQPHIIHRKQAKKDHGKGSLEELILKTMVNSGYGKTAQNVIQKNTWTAFKDEMEDIGCSSITNPVSAAMITSIVRPKRQVNMLPDDFLKEKLSELINDIKK